VVIYDQSQAIKEKCLHTEKGLLILLNSQLLQLGASYLYLACIPSSSLYHIIYVASL